AADGGGSREGARGHPARGEGPVRDRHRCRARHAGEPERARRRGARRMSAPEVPRLELRGIARRYGATQALAGVDLTVFPGEIHALVGENGAGKSTLMRILAGVVAPDAGTV